jgi:hypothetical protein
MVERDGEVGEANVAGWTAADGEAAALDPAGADDLAPLGARGDSAEEEGHPRYQ